MRCEKSEKSERRVSSDRSAVMRTVITPPLVPQPKPAPQLRTWKRSKRKSKHLTARERRLLAVYDQGLARDAWRDREANCNTALRLEAEPLARRQPVDWDDAGDPVLANLDKLSKLPVELVA